MLQFLSMKMKTLNYGYMNSKMVRRYNLNN